MINGKGKYRLWAHKKNGELIAGKVFHLHHEYLKYFCKTLQEHGWTINQIKKGV